MKTSLSYRIYLLLQAHTFCLVDGIELLVDALEVGLFHSSPPELCQDGFQEHLAMKAGVPEGSI